MAASQNVFASITADDIPGITSQLNDWGNNLTSSITELRSAILLQTGELQNLRDGFIVMEGIQARAQQFGSQAVAELDVLMQAFRFEFVLNKSEQTATGDTLKEELRSLTGHLQSKFLEVETVQ